MPRVLYLDCFSGISGDMLLGACLDAGLPLESLRAALGSLAVSGYDIGSERVLRAGVSATRFVVREADVALAAEGRARPHSRALDHSHEHSHPQDHGRDHAHGDDHDDAPGHAAGAAHPHRSLPEIFGLIDRSALSSAGRLRAKGLFQRLAEAEAAIHQMPVEQVHLHEVGALDSIIDIVGGVFALEWIGADRVVCSPLNVGGGMVRSAHGLFPVPAPATVSLLGAAPIYAGPVQKELVTPTGALLATGYAAAYGPIPAMTIERTGYGAGTRDHAGTPNVLRILIGEEAGATPGDRVVVIECEIDDMNPQLFGAAMERLHAAGALDVFFVPVQMKKNRPGTLMTVIAPPALRSALADIIFRETTTIGLRHYEVAREVLEREIVAVETPLGPVRFKVARRGGRIVNTVPEFDDCAALARQANVPVKEVQALALHAYAAREDAHSLS
jgi:pyridinium-3,5-bisthiocarboxylic acid mononucleotide nickel chelatase